MKYEVIKDIPDGWETTAKVGDILVDGWFEGHHALYLGDKAVCDACSEYHEKHCKAIEGSEVLKKGRE